MLIGDTSGGESTIQRDTTPPMATRMGVVGSPTSSSESGSGDCSIFEPDFDLSPLIKEELRTTIRNRRINSGKSDDLSYDDPPKPQYKLTKEEEEKRQVRRDRNRIAAAKCRQKRKQETMELSLESEKLQTTNARLREEIEKLQHEKETLIKLINSHRPTCIMKTGRDPNVAHTVHSFKYSVR
ncbi:cyclic AMP-dependent transcription factor ATF-3-like [Acanthaster planci]|uniref:Cyclic AMP-dependent transcription factor ATF-3-like n=1 Tax=Acanthaster planci TaxID=133434 RepID=A0A8B7ZHW8_ACAPL|nr:cyclic AMP-dependent transcription factor ATF-3-like [Acanthaster planci]XP_022105179.1 cyclic AMP-dependent transcription factor ATF-3-like [Acanthaster planci]XP_022105187.1 cyclic AMP-dependent transcription factor ATF-3-like [Acanthaster planci]